MRIAIIYGTHREEKQAYAVAKKIKEKIDEFKKEGVELTLEDFTSKKNYWPALSKLRNKYDFIMELHGGSTAKREAYLGAVCFSSDLVEVAKKMFIKNIIDLDIHKEREPARLELNSKKEYERVTAQEEVIEDDKRLREQAKKRELENYIKLEIVGSENIENVVQQIAELVNILKKT